jgi:hypothetical protein
LSGLGHCVDRRKFCVVVFAGFAHLPKNVD